MKTRIFIKGWERIRASFWFVPSIMALGAVGLFVVSISIDRQRVEAGTPMMPYFYAGGAEGARSLLSTVAGSMITVTGVVFSITIVAFTLASSQFSPRLLRNYMRDAGNQVTLGTFLSTFLYCLLVLRTVRGTDGDTFVPHVSVTCAVVLTVFNVAILIYFIHHASLAIQADQIIASLGRELDDSVERIFPRKGEDVIALAGISEVLQHHESASRVIASPQSNYLQGVDEDELMELALREDWIIEALWRPGQFVVEGQAMARVSPAVPEQRGSEILGAFVLGTERTGSQDFEFALQQLVEVALRALSPSLNDPFTAISAIDRLSAVLVKVTRRGLPSPYRVADGELRLILPTPSFDGLMDAAFHQIRQSARGNAGVLIRLMEALSRIAGESRDPAHRAAVFRHGQMVERSARESVPERDDREDLLDRYSRLKAEIGV